MTKLIKMGANALFENFAWFKQNKRWKSRIIMYGLTESSRSGSVHLKTILGPYIEQLTN